MGSPCSLMTVFRLTHHYGDLAVPLPISPDACSNISYKADRKNSFAPQERPSLDTSMEKFTPAACVYREDHVCLIQPLKSSKSTDPHFPNISFFFFLPEIALTSKQMKNACVQVAAGKASRRRDHCPGMVQVMSLSKGTEVKR